MLAEKPLGATGGQSQPSKGVRAGGETVNCHFRRFLSVVYVVALAAITRPLVAQQAPQPPQPAQPVSSGTAEGSTSIQGIRGTIGFPYSAGEVTVRTHTLADGTKITQKQLVKVYQDSEGRTRREYFKPGVESVGQDDSLLSVHIFDPVAGANYYLNPRDRRARKIEVRRPTPPSPPQTTGASANLTRAPLRRTREDLGTQVIEGLEARGERITRTIPAGAEGNDQPIQITLELWFSVERRLPLLRITNDPRYGETVTRLTNLVRDEPPAELFQVPPDYTIEELQPVAKPEPPSD
jgi:hypothetical protein